MRVLIGGIGYRNLRDHSFGVSVVDELAIRSWPPGISVEDLSYGPIAVVQRLEDEAERAPFDRAVIVSAVERAGRPAGTLTIYRWDGVLPSPDAIQIAVTEGVTGVIAMDNTLLIARHFDALPAEVIVIELQPAEHEFGDGFSPSVSGIFQQACDIVTAAALDPLFSARVPAMPLGGGAPRQAARVWPRVSHA